MSSQSRVARTPDVRRIAEAVSAPGIDPRCWECLAYVTEFNIDEEGPYVDVILMPENYPETARVGAEYAGPNFGLYVPIEKDTEVVVGFPGGDPDEGLVVLRRLWSKSDPPPQLARDNPEDIILVAKEGANIRIVTQGGGQVLVQDIDGEAKELALKSDVQEVVDALTNSATGGADGGATYKANITLSLTQAQTPTGTEVLKGE